VKTEKLTSKQLARRNYEERHKSERLAATKVFSTRIPTDTCNEINAFLKENNTTKVQLIYAGFSALKNDIRHRTK